MSLRKAINAKCKDCIYDRCAPGNWRKQVEGCSIKSCSLWPYRPRSKGKRQCDADLAPLAEVAS